MEQCAEMKPTGVPPHVEQMTLLRKCFGKMMEIVGGFETQTESLIAAVWRVINKNDVQSWNLILTTLEV